MHFSKKMEQQAFIVSFFPSLEENSEREKNPSKFRQTLRQIAGYKKG